MFKIIILSGILILANAARASTSAYGKLGCDVDLNESDAEQVMGRLELVPVNIRSFVTCFFLATGLFLVSLISLSSRVGQASPVFTCHYFDEVFSVYKSSAGKYSARHWYKGVEEGRYTCEAYPTSLTQFNCDRMDERETAAITTASTEYDGLTFEFYSPDAGLHGIPCR